MPGSIRISAFGGVGDVVDLRNEVKFGREVGPMPMGSSRSEPSELSKEVDAVLVVEVCEDVEGGI